MTTWRTELDQHVLSGVRWQDIPDSERERICLLWCRDHDVSVSDVLDHSGYERRTLLCAAVGGGDEIVQMLRDGALRMAESIVRAAALRAWDDACGERDDTERLLDDAHRAQSIRDEMGSVA